MSEMDWLDEIIAKCQLDAKNVPTKALLTMTKKIYLEQHHRLEIKKTQMDGELWSREFWEK